MQNRELWEKIKDNFFEFLWIVDAKGKVIMANDKASQSFPDGLPKGLWRSEHLYNEVEIDVVNGDGDKISLLISCGLLEDKQAYLITASDQNPQKKVEQEMAELLMQTEKLTSLGEVSAGLAHELKQPLNVISLICQSLQREIKKGRFKEDNLNDNLTNIKDQTTRMGEIIDHMRNFTRKSDPKARERFCLNESVQRVSKFLHQQMSNNGIDFKLELANNLPTTLGNPTHIEQLFLNLVTNAKKAHASKECSAKEGAFILVKTSCGEDGQIILEIKDNGPGIPKELHEKILTPFFTTAPKGEGTGLGLSLCRKIIKNHNGNLEFESEPGKGTTFRVFLGT